MTIQPNYPGVYVQEVPSGVRTIAGVSTSTTLFIGAAKAGPMNAPTLCTNYTEFDDVFSSDSSKGDMARYVKLFFLNGGTRCYVMRIARDATRARVTLQNEAGAGVLELVAKSPGLEGENLRAVVTYKGLQPEVTFNLEVWRVAGATGVTSLVEQFQNLSMDPRSSTYAPTYLRQNSKLVDANDVSSVVSTAGGFSRSGRPIPYSSTTTGSFAAAWTALLSAGTRFQISVDGNAYVPVDLSGVTVANVPADMAANIKGVINPLLAATGSSVTVDIVAGPSPVTVGDDSTAVLVLRSDSATGNVFIRPAATSDLAAALRLGTAQGGLEVGAYAARRPAPSGVSWDPTVNAAAAGASVAKFGDIEGAKLTAITIDGITIPIKPALGAARLWMAEDGTTDGVRQNLARLRDVINAFAADTTKNFQWKAEVWGSRLSVQPTSGDDNELSAAVTDNLNAMNPFFRTNVRRYSVGVHGANLGLQTSAAAPASDGIEPAASDYDAAYLIADAQIDIFNLLVLPPTAGTAAVPQRDLWGNASAFCQRRRAFLLMDSPVNWTDAQTAVNQIGALRTGLVKDHAAVFHPKITVQEDGLRVDVGPSGAIAGLCARIDANRGVWKAPAGTEADLRGVVGLSQRFTDEQNGVMNPEGINVIRSFPEGIVNWGARTMDGADSFGSEYKYIPIRRLALYIEESLYRGLKWAVFEPNDEPLWAQIRLNVGAFMHDLFRQGAFQGATPSKAYFVKCDAETTTQSDRNLGKVNIWVGFAPLKPAEFVLLYLQQMAGQL